jgi:dihydrofolate reductase
MRKLFVSNMVSLDGFFEAAHKELDWHTGDEEFFGYAKEMLRSVDTILFGRKTYQLMAAYWPSAAKDEIAEKMNNLPKIVFSRTLKKVGWKNSRLISGEASAEISRLKQQPGRDMVILGSASLAAPLLQQGLIDEYRVIVSPVLIGSGNPLFPRITQRVKLTLKQTKVLGSGTVILYYQKG